MKLQFSNPISWVYVLFWIMAACILFYFPENDTVKYGFLVLAFIVGLIVPQLQKDQPTEVAGSKFYLKSPRYSLAPILGSLVLLAAFFILKGIIAFLALLYGLIIMVSTLVMLFFPSRRQPEYIEVREEGIYRPFRGAITMKFSNVKYAELTAEHLTFYEKWADHKIVFSEFKDGDKLKDVLVAKIEEVGIEMRRI